VEPLKLRVLNQFGVSQPLGNPDEIEVTFPYESDSLVKRMSYGHVKILNDKKGEIEVSLSSFDVQGMTEGKNQNFSVKLILGDKFKTVMFERSLHVEKQMVDGEERKVITR
jgi:hypothetical protein